MTKRQQILLGAGAGVGWSVLMLWAAARFLTLPVFTLVPTILTAFLAPGVVMMLMIGRLALQRLLDDAAIDGGAFAPGSRAAIDRRVLANTTEQLLLALCLWPGAAVLLGAAGPGVIVALGLNFALARLVYWAGWHLAPPLRALGFAAGFFPTVLVTFWALSTLLVRAG